MSRDTADRVWAFQLPAEGLGSEPMGGVPGLSLNSRGGIAMVAGGRAIRQSILLLLATRPGERVMRPEYGCCLHRLVFAPNDAGTAGLAMHYIRQAVERWQPRVIIERLEAGADLHGATREGVLDILLHYRVRETGWEEQLDLGYHLQEARLMAMGAGGPVEPGQAP